MNKKMPERAWLLEGSSAHWWYITPPTSVETTEYIRLDIYEEAVQDAFDRGGYVERALIKAANADFESVPGGR